MQNSMKGATSLVTSSWARSYAEQNNGIINCRMQGLSEKMQRRVVDAIVKPKGGAGASALAPRHETA